MAAIPRPFTILGNSPSSPGAFNGFTSTGTGVFTSAATSGIQLYNTADQTTNYERLEVLWSGDVGIIRTAAGGTGASGNLQLGSSTFGNTILIRGGQSAGGGLTFTAGGSSAAVIGFSFVHSANTATSGSVVGLSLTPTYNQTSGTAANTDFLINRTETAVGSGNQYLIQAQVGGSDRFRAYNNGNVDIGVGQTNPFFRFGGTTNAFPALKRTATQLQARLADDSTSTSMQMLFLELTNSVVMRSGSGSPESVVSAAVGSVFLRTDGGASTTLYVKESGTGNTGWVAK